MEWDPLRYLTFAQERGRAFDELLARVDAQSPTTVVDLGSGPGTFTSQLATRWPQAHVIGVDSSPAMVDFAVSTPGRIDFVLGDLHTWRAAEPVDVLISNATLQWIPDHLYLLDRWVESVVPGGYFAFQVPRNFDEPTHTIRAELATEEPYAPYLGYVAPASSHPAPVYVRALHKLGCTVDSWESTYFHVLQGEDPVFEWVAATSARPTLDALPDELRPQFEEEFKARLRAAYPAGPGGTVMPFTRVFVVARAGAS